MFEKIIIESGRSRAEWALMLGISEPHLSLLLNGKKRPSLDLAARIETRTDGRVRCIDWIFPPSSEARRGAA